MSVLRTAVRIGILAAAAICLGGEASALRPGPGRVSGHYVPFAGPRVVFGETQRLSNGAMAYTWARINAHGRVQEVGASIPRSLIANPPMHGEGPLGAFLSLDFPEEAQSTTYFNHFEAHWNPEGHPPNIYGAPHFDFHFYSIPEGDVWNIMPPDNRPPDPDQLPAGYIYPGVLDAVPQMGVHANDPLDFTRPFEASMVLGYWHGAMIFVEPMITQNYLLRHPNFAKAMPRPTYLYRSTEYPAVFRSFYNRRSQSFELSFTGFSSISAPPVIED